MRYLDNYSLLGPVQAYPDIFELFSPDTASVHMAVAANPDIIFNPLSRVEKKIYKDSDNVWTGESEYFRIR